MDRFAPRDMERFLRLIDVELGRPCEIVLSGGAAVGLAYHSSHATADIDLWSDPGTLFWKAVKRAERHVAKPIPIASAPIAEPPGHFEDRLKRLHIRGLKKLVVKVPEAHDLALLKTARGEAHDLDAVEEIHRMHPLSLETLIERYHETRPQVMGPEERFRLSFLALVARLFGEAKAIEVERSLGR